MEIRYMIGDMFKGPERAVVHGCNARGVMGSGVAKTVRDNYPEAYTAYRAVFESRGLTVGEVIWAESNGKLIGNAITQADFGSNPKQIYVSYDGIAMAIKSVNTFAKAHGITEIAMPLIGAVRGGGDWAQIEQIIEGNSTDFTPVVYKFPEKPT